MPTAAVATMKSLTPVVIVDTVEPCVTFWPDTLGFRTKDEVPGDDGKLIFASLKKDGVELMYQTKASVMADSPTQADEIVGHTIALFFSRRIDAALDVVERATKSAPVVKPRHKTFYGSTEFYVREPGGNIIGFAAF